MLSCIYNNNIFLNDQPGYSEIDKRLLGRNKLLICPVCNLPVYYNFKGKVVSHFSHYPGTACDIAMLKSHDTDENKHNAAKNIFADWIREVLPGALVIKDRYFPEIRLLSDIYFETENTAVVLELQFSHITPDLLIERRRKYSDIGVKDIWIFMKEGAFVLGSPYERHYYGSNNRELYYYSMDDDCFSYFKGLKKEKFDTACLPLNEYITGSHSLSKIGINNYGELILPGCYEIYREKLLKERSALHIKIKKRKEFREDAKKRLERKNSYNSKHDIKSETQQLKERLLREGKTVETPTYGKKLTGSKIAEYSYSEFFVQVRGGKNYLSIYTGIDNNEFKYEILTHSKASGMNIYICRCLQTNNTGIVDGRYINGKGYIIRIYENRKIFTCEDWF